LEFEGKNYFFEKKRKKYDIFCEKMKKSHFWWDKHHFSECLKKLSIWTFLPQILASGAFKYTKLIGNYPKLNHRNLKIGKLGRFS
jgi:hypothetical protein